MKVRSIMRAVVSRYICVLTLVMTYGCNTPNSEGSSVSNNQAPTNVAPAQSVPSSPPTPSNITTSSSDGTQTPTNLAIIDAGGYISSSDSKVDDYRNMLKALRQKYGGSFEQSISESEQERRIGEVLIVCQRQLNEKGIKESLLDLGWHLDEQLSAEEAKQLGLVQASAVYVIDRIGKR
jgi:hypothetical protein